MRELATPNPSARELMRHKSLVKWLAVSATLALGGVAPAFGESAGPYVNYEWRDGRLSIEASAAPLRDLVTTIVRTTDAEVRGIANIEGSASIRFERRTLRDGLAALLTQFSYAMFDAPNAGGGGKHIVVIVLGRKPELDPDAGSYASQKRIALPETWSSITTYGPDTYEAIQRLADLGDRKALSEAASSNDVTTRALSMQNLARLDPDGARRLSMIAATSEDTADRVLALQVLGGLDSEESSNALGAALNDTDTAVRHAAVIGLMGQSGPSVASWLERALRDDAEPIRVLAMQLLTRRSVSVKQ